MLGGLPLDEVMIPSVALLPDASKAGTEPLSRIVY
jgi:hypothetical protein